MKFLIFALAYFATVHPSVAREFPSFVGTYHGTVRFTSKEAESSFPIAKFQRPGRFIAESGQFSLKFQKDRTFFFQGFFGTFLRITGPYRRSPELIRFSAQRDGFFIKGRIRNSSKHYYLTVHQDYPNSQIDYTFLTPTPTPTP